MHLISSHDIIIIIIIINIGVLFWSLLVICKEDGPNDNQNKRGGAARIVANDHLDDPASYVPLILVIVGHLQRGQSQRQLFGPKKAKYGRLISVPKWPKMVNLTVIHCESQNALCVFRARIQVLPEIVQNVSNWSTRVPDDQIHLGPLIFTIWATLEL